eukprot:973332_1
MCEAAGEFRTSYAEFRYRCVSTSEILRVDSQSAPFGRSFGRAASPNSRPEGTRVCGDVRHRAAFGRNSGIFRSIEDEHSGCKLRGRGGPRHRALTYTRRATHFRRRATHFRWRASASTHFRLRALTYRAARARHKDSLYVVMIAKDRKEVQQQKVESARRFDLCIQKEANAQTARKSNFQVDRSSAVDRSRKSVPDPPVSARNSVPEPPQVGRRNSPSDSSSLRNALPEHSGIRNSLPEHSGIRNSLSEHSGIRNSLSEHSGIRNSLSEHSGIRNSLPERSGVRNSLPERSGVRNALSDSKVNQSS